MAICFSGKMENFTILRFLDYASKIYTYLFSDYDFCDFELSFNWHCVVPFMSLEYVNDLPLRTEN